MKCEFPLLCGALLLSVFRSEKDSNFHFSFIDHENMSFLYSEYELCMLYHIPYSAIKPHLALHLQPYCQKYPKTLSFDSITNISIPPNCFLNGLNWANKDSLYGYFSQHFPRFHSFNSSCVSYNFTQRSGFRKQWNLPSPIHSHGHSGDLMRYLLSQGIHSIFFVGDSLTRQSHHFLECDLLRNGNHVVKNSVFQLKDDSTASERVLFTTLPRPDFDYLYDVNRRKGDVYMHLTSYFESQLGNSSSVYHSDKSTSRRMVVVFEAGAVRLGTNISLAEMILIEVARSVLDFTKKYPIHIFVFRETSAQHFSHSIGGNYIGDAYHAPYSSPESPSYCCTLRNAMRIQGDRANAVLKLALTSIDFSWKHRLGWIPFFEYSLSFYDLHVERRVPDCTHWVYSPNMFDILWFELRQEIERKADKSTGGTSL